MDALYDLSDPLQAQIITLMSQARFQTLSLIKKTETQPKNTSQASTILQPQEQEWIFLTAAKSRAPGFVIFNNVTNYIWYDPLDNHHLFVK